jgi:hypothetical protein
MVSGVDPAGGSKRHGLGTARALSQPRWAVLSPRWKGPGAISTPGRLRGRRRYATCILHPPRNFGIGSGVARTRNPE